MAFFAWIQGMLPAANLPTGTAAVQKEVEFFASCGWDDGSGHSQCMPGPATLMQVRVGNSATSLLLWHMARSLWVLKRWASTGFYNAPWGPMNDQTPNYILAVHSLAISTGDKAWLETQVMTVFLVAPLLSYCSTCLQLPTVEAIAGYMLANGLADTGIFIMPGASGLADGGKHCTNW